MAKIIVGGNSSNAGPTNQPSQSTSSLVGEKKVKVVNFLSAYAKVPIAILISFGTYLLVRKVLPVEIVWWLTEVLSFVLALIVIVAVDTATSKKNTIGLSVFLFTFLLFTFFIIKGYVEHEGVNTKTETKAEVKYQPNVKKYGQGTYSLHLLKNQKSGWITVTGAYNFNKEATLVVEYASGVIVNSWDHGKWRNEYTFKIINVSDVPITLIVR